MTLTPYAAGAMLDWTRDDDGRATRASTTRLDTMVGGQHDEGLAARLEVTRERRRALARLEPLEPHVERGAAVDLGDQVWPGTKMAHIFTGCLL